MKLRASLRTVLTYTFRRSRVEREMEEELRFHLQARADDLERHGLSRAEAERQARIEFGGYQSYKEECREALGTRLLNELVADVHYGIRQLRRTPGFTAVAVITIALGIGANTAMFTIVNAILLHPLPYPDSDRIVDVLPQTCKGCGASDTVPMFTFLLQNNPGLEDLTARLQGALSVNLNGGERPEMVPALKVSRHYFRLFGANPLLGRTFSPDEDQPGGREVLLMSYGLWERRFGGDPAILGKTITLGGTPYAVIGVLAPAFRPYPSADVWIPLQADAGSTDQAHILTVSGRLPRSTTLLEVNSWIALTGRRYVETHPEQRGRDDKLNVIPILQQMTGDVRPELLILMGAVGLVLLIACANVASLMLARGMGRQKEITVRAAIGAGRGRILQQLLTESVLLAAAGGALGLTLASLGVRAVLAVAPGNVPRIGELAAVTPLDPRAAGFTVLLSVLTGVAFGVFPALQLSRTNLACFLKESGGRIGASLKAQSHPQGAGGRRN